MPSLRSICRVLRQGTGRNRGDPVFPQRDWFDAKSFPEAVFEAQSFRPKGGAAYDAVGTLTIRGVKQARPADLDR